MAAVSSTTAAGATSALPVVNKDIEARVKELIACADKKFKITVAHIDKTHADKSALELTGRAKIYICKFEEGPVSLIPILYTQLTGYLLVALRFNYIYYNNTLIPKSDVARFFKGESTSVQIQLADKN